MQFFQLITESQQVKQMLHRFNISFEKTKHDLISNFSSQIFVERSITAAWKIVVALVLNSSERVSPSINALMCSDMSTPSPYDWKVAPGFAANSVKLIVDNDYAAFYGTDTTVTRLLNQNNVDWQTQIANASAITILFASR